MALLCRNMPPSGEGRGFLDCASVLSAEVCPDASREQAKVQGHVRLAGGGIINQRLVSPEPPGLCESARPTGLGAGGGGWGRGRGLAEESPDLSGK